MKSVFSRRSLLAAAGGTLAVTFAARGIGRAQDATPEAGISHPTGANELVLRISSGGGFVPVTVSLSELPTISLYGDGTLVHLGPTTLQYPGYALPNLRQIKLNEGGIQAVLVAAQTAGLLDGDKDYPNDFVTDLPTTTFITNANGKTSIVSAYALGFDEDPDNSEEIKAARAALVAFRNSVLGVATNNSLNVESPDTLYPIERLQIVAELIDPSAGTPEAGYSNEIVWPLTTSLADATPATDLLGEGGGIRCGIIDGADAQAVVEAAQSATTLTPWVSGEERYLVTFRPLMVDELGCPPTAVDPNATPIAKG